MRWLIVSILLLLPGVMWANPAEADPGTTHTLTGRVMLNGEPVPDVEVYLRESPVVYDGDEDAYDVFKETAQGRTDADGIFQLQYAAQKAQDLFLDVVKDDYGCLHQRVSVGSPQSVLLKMERVVIVRGKVTCPERPDVVTKTNIFFRGDAAGCFLFESQPLHPQADGTFLAHMRPVYSGRYRGGRCFVGETSDSFQGIAQYPVTREWFTTNGDASIPKWDFDKYPEFRADIRLSRLWSGRIHFVNQYGDPLTSHSIGIQPVAGRVAESRSGDMRALFRVSGKTDANGCVELQNVWSDNASMGIQGREVQTYYWNRGFLAPVTSATLKTSDITCTVTTLARTKWYGTVRDKEGKPIPDVLLQLTCHRYHALYHTFQHKYGRTDAQGRYAIVGMPYAPDGAPSPYKPGYKEVEPDKNTKRDTSVGYWAMGWDNQGEDENKDIPTDAVHPHDCQVDFVMEKDDAPTSRTAKTRDDMNSFEENATVFRDRYSDLLSRIPPGGCGQ